MIRVRKQDGSADKVDQSEAVEILGDDGRLALAVVQDHRGMTHIVGPGDALFNAYCKTHGMAPATVHRHEPLPVQSPM